MVLSRHNACHYWSEVVLHAHQVSLLHPSLALVSPVPGVVHATTICHRIGNSEDDVFSGKKSGDFMDGIGENLFRYRSTCQHCFLVNFY